MCFVVHASNCTRDVYQDISKWTQDLGGIVVPPTRTSWGGVGTVKAEGLLFDTATEKFPPATHFWLVSEKTIPCMSANAVQRHLKSPKYKNHSLITPIRKIGGGLVIADVKTSLKEAGWTLELANQFLVVHRQHWVKICKPFWECVPKLLPYSWEEEVVQGTSVSADEFLIQTLLASLCDKGEIKRQCVVANYFDNSFFRAQRAREVGQSEILFAARDATNNPPLVFGIRKVFKVSQQLLCLLESEGVLKPKA